MLALTVLGAPYHFSSTVTSAALRQSPAPFQTRWLERAFAGILDDAVLTGARLVDRCLDQLGLRKDRLAVRPGVACVTQAKKVATSPVQSTAGAPLMMPSKSSGYFQAYM